MTILLFSICSALRGALAQSARSHYEHLKRAEPTRRWQLQTLAWRIAKIRDVSRAPLTLSWEIVKISARRQLKTLASKIAKIETYWIRSRTIVRTLALISSPPAATHCALRLGIARANYARCSWARLRATVRRLGHSFPE